MAVFAQIENGIIANLIVAKADDVAKAPYVDTGGLPAAIGWGFVDGAFVAPAVADPVEPPPSDPDLISELLGRVAALEAKLG